MAPWQDGTWTVVRRQIGAMVVAGMHGTLESCFWHGKFVGWHRGSMVDWHGGSMVDWHVGSMVVLQPDRLA